MMKCLILINENENNLEAAHFSILIRIEVIEREYVSSACTHF